LWLVKETKNLEYTKGGVGQDRISTIVQKKKPQNGKTKGGKKKTEAATGLKTQGNVTGEKSGESRFRLAQTLRSKIGPRTSTNNAG